MVSLVLQAEIKAKASTIEKNKNNVAAAMRKQARLEELSKQLPELQQVSCQHAVFVTCYDFVWLAHIQHVLCQLWCSCFIDIVQTCQSATKHQLLQNVKTMFQILCVSFDQDNAVLHQFGVDDTHSSHLCCTVQANAALEARCAQQAKELASAQSQIKQLGREATASVANTSNLQKQQEVGCDPLSLCTVSTCMAGHLMFVPCSCSVTATGAHQARLKRVRVYLIPQWTMSFTACFCQIVHAGKREKDGVPVRHLLVQADLARAQSEEQTLHLKIVALDGEVKQKGVQLTELRKAKMQVDEQLAAAKAQAEKASADLKDRTAQLSTAQATLAAQQAAVKPAGDSAPAPVPTPQVLLSLY